MRPYIAIIKDSFREAVASRVLWLMFALITLVLISFAPLTYREEMTVGLRRNDIEEPVWPTLFEKLREAAASEEPSPARRLWTTIGEAGQGAVNDYKPLPEKPNFRDFQESGERRDTLLESLDEAVRRDDFYDEESWKGITPGRELKELQKTPYRELPAQERLRYNRLLLEAAFPDIVIASPATSLQFRYAAWDMFMPLPLRKSDFVERVIGYLPWLIDKGILSIGLLIAVLVTAPVIPQTFDPGSLHLLLSKPVARPLMYLSKFLGGCAFVFLCATYLFCGLWLIFGIQWAIWEPQLLWCIPVYVFVFATYYSVSALAGAISRNTIVAVIATIVFWTVCFLIGTSYVSISNTILRYRIGRIVPLKDEVLAVDEVNTFLAWDDETHQWRPSYVSSDQEQIRLALIMLPEIIFQHPPPMVGPVYDERNEQVVAATVSYKMFGRMVLVSARQNGSQWKLAEGSPTPGPPIAFVLEPDGRTLLVTGSGILRVTRDVSSNAVMLRMPGFSFPLGRAESLEDAGPEPARYWIEPAAAAMDDSSGSLLIYSDGQLMSLAKDAQRKYQPQTTKRVFDEERQPVLMAAGEGQALIARESGQIVALAATTLNETGEFQIPSQSPPRSLVLSPDGKQLLVLCHDGYLHLLDLPSGKFTRPWLRGQGDISAVAVDSGGRLYLASRARRVIQYDLATLKPQQTYAQPLDMQEWSYYYFIVPAHAILPKPGEFYNTVQYLLSGQQTAGKDAENLATAQKNLDPWSPIWSGLAFQVVMLGLGCLYIQRQEF